MGGDGGVIASNRKYMRGVSGPKVNVSEAERDAQMQTMKTCALTGAKLDYSNIVACPYGKLYHREAAVKALLRRVEGKNEKSEDSVIGDHIRGLKYLATVRFNLIEKMENGEKIQSPLCPVTQVELNGIQPAFLIVKKKSKGSSQDSDQVNVISEKAMKEIGLEALNEQYGPFQLNDCIRLAPPASMMEEIKIQVEEKRSQKKISTKKKKRKMELQNTNGLENEINETSKTNETFNDLEHIKKKKPSTTETVNLLKNDSRSIHEVRSKVASTISSSHALSGLYGCNAVPETEKEKKDNLFAR
jgi:hypothetical protein